MAQGYGIDDKARAGDHAPTSKKAGQFGGQCVVIAYRGVEWFIQENQIGKLADGPDDGVHLHHEFRPRLWNNHPLTTFVDAAELS